ncbi:GRIP and coiled-coil domain-containing protein 2 [Papilio xuthus]|uniref:GRIP and coiled-coil domain-containing protein 2 n=1 Tax=Papilio xuthus TaxID=66420 RepID=A0A194PL30_PAPXU|nr:GRIP and coiled-coil domain-containing protein 2 [Papilio xuthus]
METDKKNSDGVKKSPFDDLSKEELITKCKGLLVIAQKAKQAKSELQSQTETYKQQLEKCETEKNTYLQNNKTLQELVDSLTEQKLNYITEIDGAQAKVKALGEKCHSFEDEINRLKADLIIKDQSIADISLKLSDYDSEIISLKRQNNRLVEENEQLITQLSDMETRIAEFNNIGLQQREQLQILEQKFQTDDSSELKIKELNEIIKQLELDIEAKVSSYEEKVGILDNKAKEMTNLYESEKNKKDKNSRFILSKTVKEYSENVPKWQNEILKASKVLDKQINELNNKNASLNDEILDLRNELMEAKNNCNMKEHQNLMNKLSEENNTLKKELCNLEKQVSDLTQANLMIKEETTTIDLKQHEVLKSQLDKTVKENGSLYEKVNDLTGKVEKMNKANKELSASYEKVKEDYSRACEYLHKKAGNEQKLDELTLQVKALESEKAILVKKKLISRDVIAVLETQNKNYINQVDSLKQDVDTKKSQVDKLSQEILTLKESHNTEKDAEINQMKTKIITLQDMNDKLKKEYDDLLDLNGLLREEVDTLKLSLEQPKDDSEHLSDLNVSLQADIVKLETKLSAYKQENASLLTETKELRAKVNDYDNIVSECENAKSKLLSYKTENTELLNEMKEINEVLKERGEAISKLQKAVSEMEKLIESLEKDRDEIKEERANLVRKIETLECDLKTANQITNQNSDDMKKIALEKENVAQMLTDKENIIANLKEDIERLKQQTFSSASELPNDDMSTSTISKAEEHSRMKDLDETFEDKYTKLRLFALKLKRKLKEVTAQLQNTEQENVRLKKMIDESVYGDQNKPIATSKSDDIDGATKTNEKTSEIVELNEKVKSLTQALEASKQSLSKLESLEAELQTKEQQINAEKEAHKATKEQLDKALRDVKKKNVLSLEMEDYERSMKDLTTKMEENKKKIIQMESTIDTQEGTINAMKTQIKLLEEQIKAEETQNRLLKEELHHAIEDGKEKENVLNSKKDIISKLMQDLEDEKRKTEESELEMTALLSDKEKIIISLGEEKSELNNKMKRLEFKCADINEKLKITNIELADLKTEYTSYKVRAQAVLRQNQTVDHSHEEQLKEETAALRAQIESLTANLNTLQAQYSEQCAEVEACRKRVSEAGAEAARAHQRTSRLQADLTRLAHQLESERAQHKLQVSTLTQCYKAQIVELETKLQKETESLRSQLAAALERKSGESERVPDKQYMLPVIPKDEISDGEIDFNVTMIPREEGEGSESASSPPLSKPYLTSAEGRRSPMPLERLLEEGVPDDDALDTAALSLTPEQEIAELRRKLQGQQQRVKHVTVLLAESERECARMAQLSELLKGELRRVRGASAHAHNTEYMKNVTFKFLTLPPGDERSRLIPVLQKILTLTPDETQKIQAIAKGQDPNSGKGWGSYLPWPAGK